MREHPIAFRQLRRHDRGTGAPLLALYRVGVAGRRKQPIADVVGNGLQPLGAVALRAWPASRPHPCWEGRRENKLLD